MWMSCIHKDRLGVTACGETSSVHRVVDPGRQGSSVQKGEFRSGELIGEILGSLVSLSIDNHVSTYANQRSTSFCRISRSVADMRKSEVIVPIRIGEKNSTSPTADTHRSG